jgi:hypothetical protein
MSGRKNSAIENVSKVEVADPLLEDWLHLNEEV